MAIFAEVTEDECFIERHMCDRAIVVYEKIAENQSM